ncbi:endonuclease domain-containing protein [Labilibaculum manganireducens]|uniref:endonuclease domain-containing protein n=1 Tax=Labilibaculum manganireducens TaxID=1940525 RepID=UPI0029F4CA00|nr:endonuclease domain-containing protein [Labilibaculum manganireducens]
MKYIEIKDVKRKLRCNPTLSEKLLWKYIRNRKLLGRKFLRQHAIIYDHYEDENFFFIPDFYCEAEKLAIELDGKVHDFTKVRDVKRDEILTDMGIKVVRFKNEELINMPTVLAKIESYFHRNDNDPVFERKSLK